MEETILKERPPNSTRDLFTLHNHFGQDRIQNSHSQKVLVLLSANKKLTKEGIGPGRKGFLLPL